MPEEARGPLRWHVPYAEDVACQVLTNGMGGMTLESIGKCFGVSRERVRQVERKALASFKEAWVREGYSIAELREVLELLSAARSRAEESM